MDRSEDLGAWMRRQLARREWNAAELARRSGIGSGRISEWMTGKNRPNPESCLRLADVFNVDPDIVLTLAGHRVATSPLPADDAKTRIIELVRRAPMTESQAAGLEAMLTAWIDAERSSAKPNGAPKRSGLHRYSGRRP